MKKLLLIIVLPFILMSCVSSKRIAFLSTKNLDKPDTLNLRSYENKYGDYDGVFLDVERTYEHTGSKSQWWGFNLPDWNFDIIYREKYLVLNPDNDRFTTFDYSVGKSAKIANFFLKATSPDGKVAVYGLKDCKQETDQYGNITYKFVYPDVKKGTIIDEGIEYGYSRVRGYVPLEHEIPLQFSVPCEHLTFNYCYPDWWKINVKKISENDSLKLQVANDLENHKTTLEYQANDIPAIDDEVFSPFYKEMAKYLDFMVTNMSMGNIIYKTPGTWADLGKGFKDYAMNKDGFLSTMVSDTTEALIKDCKTDFEKVDKIISYIQDNIKVDPAFSDKSFKKIIINRKGDILSINGLAQSMLTKAGFKTDFLLLHTESEGNFDPNYINSYQFTEPAVRTYIDGKEYVLLPYLKYLQAGYLPEDLQGQPVLVISNDSPAKLDKIGAANIKDDSYNENFNITIDENGILNINEEKSIDGIFAYSIRKKLSTATEDEIKKFVNEIISYDEGNVNLKNYEILNKEEYKKPLIIKLNYTIDNLVTVTPEEIIFQTAGLFSPSPFEKKKFKEDKRNNPIKIYYNSNFSKEISVSYPAEWEVQTKLKDVDYKNIFGEVKSHYEISDGKLKAVQSQFLKKSSQPKEKFNELKEILGSNSKISIPAIVFNVKEQSSKN